MTTGSHAAESTHAYATAPGITSEITWVIRHSIPRLSDDEREFWLRKAAVFDRMALAEAARFAPEVAAPAAEAAVQVARQLIEYDVARNGLSSRRPRSSPLRTALRTCATSTSSGVRTSSTDFARGSGHPPKKPAAPASPSRTGFRRCHQDAPQRQLPAAWGRWNPRRCLTQPLGEGPWRGGPVTNRARKGGDKLTVEELCEELRIARSTFYDWRQKGRAPRCLRLPNGALRIRRSDLDNWLTDCEDHA